MLKPPEGTGFQVRPLIRVLAGATVLGLLTAGWITVISRIQEEDVSFVDLAVYVLPFWYLWALYLLPVVWLAKSKPIEPDVWVSRTAMHISIALGLAASHTGLRFAFEVAAQIHPAEGGVTIADVVALVTLEAPVHLFIYGAILGITYIAGYRRRLRERELAATQLGEQLALAQVRALRMQINPHFLFNAMNSISMLVRDRKQEEAVKTIAGLSDLLRYVLDETADQEVPLRNELDFITRYLAIEKIRFQERLHVAIEVPDTAMDALVPNLLLQPLVENAIRHGVSRSAAATNVLISAAEKNGTLLLRVSDDGPGFADDRPREDGSGLGIENTRKRLAQLYGDGFTLALDKKHPHGAVVGISLPIHTKPLITWDDER